MFTDQSEIGLEDFPGGTVDKNLHVNAGDTNSVPCLGRFHTLRVGHRSPPATTTEPVLWKPRAATAELCAATAEAGAPRAHALQHAFGGQLV